MSSTELLKPILEYAFKDILKVAKFKKKGNRYTRRIGSVVQLVEIQKSMGGLSFYLKFHIGFEEIARHNKQEFDEHKPKTIYRSGINVRLDNLLDLPKDWKYDMDHAHMDRLKGGIQSLVENLNEIRSLEDFSKHKWFDENFSLDCKIYHFYFNKKFEKVTEILKDFVQIMKEKRVSNLNTINSWAEKYNLVDMVDD